MILFFDIETEPGVGVDLYEAPERKTFSHPKNYKKQETIDKWYAENLPALEEEETERLELHKQEYIDSLCLDMDLGQICTISATLYDHDKKEIKYEYVFDKSQYTEKEILLQFLNVYNDNPWVAGYNVINFDIPFIKRRMFHNEVTFLGEYNMLEAHRYKNYPVLDIMQVLKEWNGGVRVLPMKQYAKLLGLDIVEEEGKYAYKWDAEKRIEYAKNDNRIPIAMYERMKGVYKVD